MHDIDTTQPRRPPGLLDRSATVAGLVGRAIADAVEVLDRIELQGRSRAGAGHVHRARVATRRLRAALKALAEVGDPTQFDGLRSELAWLAGLLGEVRDVDVLTPLLHRALDALTGPTADPQAVAELDRRLAEHRRVAELTVLDAARSDRYRALLERLRRLARQPPLAREGDAGAPAAPVARHAARRAFRRADRYARTVGRRPPDEQLHELRKRAKRARYAAELAAPALDGETSKLGRRLSAVQDALGAHQDEATLRRWLEAQAVDELSPVTAFTVGRLHQALGDGVDRTVTWRPLWRKARRARLRR